MVMVVGGAAVAALAIWLLDPFGTAPPAKAPEEEAAVLEEAPPPARGGLGVRVREAEGRPRLIAAAPGAELRGRLVDAAGEPVVAATVALLPVEPADEETSAWLDPLAEFQLYGVFPPRARKDGTVSDTDGAFRLGNLPSGDWHLLVTAEGMRPFSRLLPRPLKPAMELDLEEMELARGLELALAVRDEDGAPVEGAEVRWRRRPQEGVLASPVSSRPRATDAAGSLALTGLPPGELLVEVRHPSYAVATLPTQAAAPAAALPVALSPARAFDGLCLAADSDLPVADASLKLMPVRGEAAAVGLGAETFDSEARSGGDGAFSFEALPPGEYFLIATHPDFATTTSEAFRVDGTGVTPFVLRLRPGAVLEVLLLDDEDMPAPQKWVLVQGERDANFQRARSDDRGIAHFERLPAGTYRVMRAEAVPIATSRHGRLHRDYEFVALRDDERRELVLGGRELLTRLEGYVVKGGRARAGRGITLLADDGVRSAVSDAAGYYSIDDLVPGSYLFQVTVSAADNPATGSFFGTVELQDEESNKRDIVLPLAAIEVHVVDDASGRELEHVPVSLRPDDGTELAVGAFASTDDRGLALFPTLRPGSYLIAAGDAAQPYLSGDGMRAAAVAAVEVKPGTEGILCAELRLGRGAAFRGRILDRDGRAVEGAQLHYLDRGGNLLNRLALQDSDAGGRASLRGLPAGEGFILARHLALGQALVAVDLVAGRESARDLVLAPGLHVDVTAVGEDGRPLTGVLVTILDGEGRPIPQPMNGDEAQVRRLAMLRGTPQRLGPFPPGDYRVQLFRPGQAPRQHPLRLDAETNGADLRLTY